MVEYFFNNSVETWESRKSSNSFPKLHATALGQSVEHRHRFRSNMAQPKWKVWKDFQLHTGKMFASSEFKIHEKISFNIARLENAPDKWESIGSSKTLSGVVYSTVVYVWILKIHDFWTAWLIRVILGIIWTKNYGATFCSPIRRFSILLYH